MTTLGNTSISDIQLVIDAANQRNVYMCTDAYRDQVLAGVTSAVAVESYEGYAGWWLEVRIEKAALDPDMPVDGTFGVEFNFRDNDNNNDWSVTTVYDWNDPTTSAGFPSKIPYNWGEARLLTCTDPAAPTAGNDGPVCLGATLNLTASTVAGATYAWTGPNGFTSADQNPSISGVTAAAAGEYSVTVTVDGCTSAPGTTSVTVSPDSDSDGVSDPCDECPNTVPGASVDAVGCPPPIPFDFDRDGDVDTAVDYAKFEACSTGPAIAGPPEGCTTEEFGRADVDADGDVDQADFAVFERCYSGTDVPANPDCSQ
jgi:hypothetical protein